MVVNRYETEDKQKTRKIQPLDFVTDINHKQTSTIIRLQIHEKEMYMIPQYIYFVLFPFAVLHPK